MNVTTFNSRDDPAADAQFDRWYQRQKGEAFFINKRSLRQATLHRAPYPHYVFRSPVRLAWHPKVCSDSVSDLREWASEARVKLVLCTDCKP